MERLFLFLFLIANAIWLKGQVTTLANDKNSAFDNCSIPSQSVKKEEGKDVEVIPTKSLGPQPQLEQVPKANTVDVQIGTQNNEGYYPIMPIFNFNYSQNIYLASEIGIAGQITKIKYYFVGNTLVNSDAWVVYMGHTTKTHFNNTSDWVPVSQLTEVFNGQITWQPNGFVEITLTTPFNYNGTDNLVIAVDENTPTSESVYSYFYCSTVSTTRGILYQSDALNPEPSAPPTAFEINTSIANIVLTITPDATNQNDLAVSVINIPEFVELGTTVTPSVIIFNKGVNSQSNYSVNLKIFDKSNNEVYNQTVNNPGTITSANTLTVNFPNWTPSAGQYTARAEVTLTNDENPANNVLTKSLLVGLLINMQNGTVTVDYGYFYDSGGPTANYSDNENLVLTISPSIQNSRLKVEFLNFETEAGYDSLRIYDAANTNSGYLGTWHGTNSPGSITAQNPTGALTFQFKSDGSITKAGWIAKITALVPSEHDMAIEDIKPAFVIQNYKIKPKVVIRNKGAVTENTWTLTLTDGQSYVSTRQNLAPIAPNETYIVEMDDWTPTASNYTFAATIVIPYNDNNDSDNQLQKNVTVSNYSSQAFTTNITDRTYSTINLQNGAENTIVSNLEVYPFPLSEDFSPMGIIRIYNNKQIGVVLPNGQFNLLGEINVVGIPTAIAYDWSNDSYYLLVRGSDYKTRLYKLDIITLQTTQVGTTAISSWMFGMDFAEDGYIYAPATAVDKLYKINPSTGEFIEVGPTNINIECEQDLTWDYQQHKLYTIVCMDLGNNNFYAFLGYYNLANGNFTMLTDKGARRYPTLVSTTIPPIEYTVTFRVTYGTNPIEGAKITIDGAELFTNSNGLATKKLKDGTYNFTVQKTGFQTYSGQLTVAGADKTVEINLIPVIAAEDISLPLTIYPNPTTDKITIVLSVPCTIDLTDVNGRMLKSITTQGTITLDVSDLAPNVYMLKIRTQNCFYVRKIAKK